MTPPLKSLRDKLEPSIIGALQACIKAHGPITADLITSATKRILGQIGAVTYLPDEEAARLAPAAICNAVSRIIWLRRKLSEMPPDVQREFAPFVKPFPFEADLMSGRMEMVDAAIKALGETL